jgi:hypothetical protein
MSSCAADDIQSRMGADPNAQGIAACIFLGVCPGFAPYRIVVDWARRWA